jgi:broad specificity phosphatase PhoE
VSTRAIFCATLSNRRSAGSRDSALTNHGYHQATRLGQHFQALGLTFTHLFSSHLQRAAQTAGKIREAQLPSPYDTATPAAPDVVQLPLLIEQDFGSMEGMTFFERPPASKLTGKDHYRLKHKDTEGFVDVESKEAMARRADEFLDGHLLPLFNGASEPADKCIAIVSHGIFLSTLWKRLLLRMPAKSIELSPELQATARVSLEHLGGWSNTGYLELHTTQLAFSTTLSSSEAPPPSTSVPSSSPAEVLKADEGLGKVVVPQATSDDQLAEKQATDVPIPAAVDAQSSSSPRIVHGLKATILAINGKDHLKGLKRTGGGVGRSRYDASQKSIETFFKRRKVE